MNNYDPRPSPYNYHPNLYDYRQPPAPPVPEQPSAALIVLISALIGLAIAILLFIAVVSSHSGVDCQRLMNTINGYLDDAARIENIPGYVTDATLMARLNDDLAQAQSQIDLGRAAGCP